MLQESFILLLTSDGDEHVVSQIELQEFAFIL